MASDFRREYVDTIVELCDAFYGEAEDRSIVWEAEYLTRGMKWFHYFGSIRDGKSESVAHQYSLDTATAERIDPANMVFTLLDFEANAHIAAYVGSGKGATDVLQRIADLWALQPEVMRISLVGQGELLSGRQVVNATEIVYIGLPSPPPAGCANLAQTKDEVSDRWYRGCRFIRAGRA